MTLLLDSFGCVYRLLLKSIVAIHSIRSADVLAQDEGWAATAREVRTLEPGGVKAG